MCCLFRPVLTSLAVIGAHLSDGPHHDGHPHEEDLGVVVLLSQCPLAVLGCAAAD